MHTHSTFLQKTTLQVLTTDTIHIAKTKMPADIGILPHIMRDGKIRSRCDER